MVLVREAGGEVSEIDGGRDMISSGDILAATHPLHATLGKILRETATEKP